MPATNVNGVIHAVAVGLEVEVPDHVSMWSVGRVMLEGGLVAKTPVGS